MGTDKFTPKVIPGGKKLSIGMVYPDLFFKYDMLKMANKYNEYLNQNSHKATVIEEDLCKIRKK